MMVSSTCRMFAPNAGRQPTLVTLLLALAMASLHICHARSLGNKATGEWKSLRRAHTMQDSPCAAHSLGEFLSMLVGSISDQQASNLHILQTFTTMPIIPLFCAYDRTACRNAMVYPDSANTAERKMLESFNKSSPSSHHHQARWRCDTDYNRFPPVMCKAVCSSRNGNVVAQPSESGAPRVTVYFLQCKSNGAAYTWMKAYDQRYFHRGTTCPPGGCSLSS
eukprot:scpid91053/ scgid21968/ 